MQTTRRMLRMTGEDNDVVSSLFWPSETRSVSRQQRRCKVVQVDGDPDGRVDEPLWCFARVSLCLLYFFGFFLFWLDSFHRIFGIGAGRRITRFVLFFVFFFCVAQPEMRTHTKRGGTIVSKAKFSEKKNEIGREKRISRLAGWWNGPEVEGRRYKWSNSNGTHASHRRADFGVVYPTESDSIWVTEGSRTLDGSLMWKQKLGNSELFSSSLRPKKRKPHNQSKKKKKRAGWVFFFFALSLSLSRAANDEWRESDKIYLNCFFFFKMESERAIRVTKWRGRRRLGLWRYLFHR